MNELAQQIADKSNTKNSKTVAISAFPHSDGTCSELSNYIVDELVLSIFTDASGLQVIERSQLEVIFSEIELGQSGKLELVTAKHLGNLLGVDTLVVGSITTLGDQLRIFARLIETETGKVFSGAATTVPRTDTIKELAKKSISGCGFSQTPKQNSIRATRRPSEKVEKRDGDLIYRIGSIRQNTINGQITATLEIENISDSSVYIKYKAKTASIIDSNSQIYILHKLGGIPICETYYANNCFTGAASLNRNDNIIITYIFLVDDFFSDGVLKKKKRKDIKEADTLTLTSQFYVWTSENENDYILKSVGFRAIPVDR